MVGYLAVRNLVLQRKRYSLMATAVVIGFLLVTVLTSAAQGAMQTVQTKAARYFAGHVSITAFRQGRQKITNPQAVINAIPTAGLPITNVTQRTVYYRQDSRLFFGGNSVRQRRLVGIDVDAEATEIATLDFRVGGLDGMRGDDGRYGVLISEVAADLLGARLGDDVSLFITTDEGQVNTATLIVRGIFRESGIFGYATYMRRSDLNELLAWSPEAATDIAMFVSDTDAIVRVADRVRTQLSQDFPVFPPVMRRQDFRSVVDRRVEQETIAVISLDAQLAEIRDLVDAFLMVANFVVVLFMLIVMFGILNTYRVLLHQRTREIGTMRALGMSRGGVKAVFLIEAATLAAIASAAGFLLGGVVLFFLERISIGTGPAIAMFTERQRLQFALRPRTVLLNLAFMMAAVVAAAWGPAHKASHLDPVEALRKDT